MSLSAFAARRGDQVTGVLLKRFTLGTDRRADLSPGIQEFWIEFAADAKSTYRTLWEHDLFSERENHLETDS